MWRRTPKISDTDSAPPSRWAAGKEGGGGAFISKRLVLRLLYCALPSSHCLPFRQTHEFSHLTCNPFVWLAVTVIRVSGKVQRIQRADAASAICAEREGHRWTHQRGDRSSSTEVCTVIHSRVCLIETKKKDLKRVEPFLQDVISIKWEF